MTMTSVFSWRFERWKFVRTFELKKRILERKPCLSRDFVPFKNVIRVPSAFQFFGHSQCAYLSLSLDPLHWVPVVSLSWRMRRESLAQVTALLKTMKQTLYERGYGANYLAISRASNKWASPRTSLFLSLLLAPPSSALFVFSRPTFSSVHFSSVVDRHRLLRDSSREIRGRACFPIVDRFVWP